MGLCEHLLCITPINSLLPAKVQKLGATCMKRQLCNHAFGEKYYLFDHLSGQNVTVALATLMEYFLIFFEAFLVCVAKGEAKWGGGKPSHHRAAELKNTVKI